MCGQQGLGHTVATVQQGLMVTSCDDEYREEGLRSKWRGQQPQGILVILKELLFLFHTENKLTKKSHETYRKMNNKQ